MKPRIHKHNPSNMHLGRATIAEGVSKQNSHPRVRVLNNIVWEMYIWFILHSLIVGNCVCTSLIIHQKCWYPWQA